MGTVPPTGVRPRMPKVAYRAVRLAEDMRLLSLSLALASGYNNIGGKPMIPPPRPFVWYSCNVYPDDYDFFEHGLICLELHDFGIICAPTEKPKQHPVKHTPG